MKKKKSPRPISKNLKAGDLMWHWDSDLPEPNMVMVLEDFKLNWPLGAFNKPVLVLDQEQRKTIDRMYLSKYKNSCKRHFSIPFISFPPIQTMQQTFTSVTHIVSNPPTTFTSNTISIEKFPTVGNTTTLLANNYETISKT